MDQLLWLRKSANTIPNKQVVTKYHSHVQPLQCYFVTVWICFVVTHGFHIIPGTSHALKPSLDSVSGLRGNSSSRFSANNIGIAVR